MLSLPLKDVIDVMDAMDVIGVKGQVQIRTIMYSRDGGYSINNNLRQHCNRIDRFRRTKDV